MREKKVTVKPRTKGVARVPFIMQMESLECGAASLAMILAYYRKWVPLEQMRVDCAVSRNGSKAVNILRAARNYGLEAFAIKCEPEALKTSVGFPCILFWEFNHYVVLCGFRHGKPVICDPAKGSFTVPPEVFDESFTGVCLCFKPGGDFVSGGIRKNIVSLVFSRLKNARDAVVLTAFFSMLFSAISILMLIISRIYIEYIAGHNIPPAFVLRNITFLAATFFLIPLFVHRSILVNIRSKGKLIITSTSGYMWHVLRLPMVFFSQRLPGELTRRKLSITNVATDIVDVLIPMSVQSILMLLYGALLFSYSSVLLALSLLAILANLLISLRISRKRADMTRVASRNEDKYASSVMTGISLIESVKATGSEDNYFSRLAGHQALINSSDAKLARLNAGLGLLPLTVSTLSGILMFSGSIYLCVVDNKWTPGAVASFLSLAALFNNPAKMLVAASQTLQEARTDVERIEDVTNYPCAPELKDPDGEENCNQKLSGHLDIHNLTFGYSPLEDPVISDFSLSLEPGRSIAIVGASGSGKSTLTKLVSGLYEPWSGEILFDGKPLKDIPANLFRSSVGVVDQEITLFSDTIENNIKMWDKSIEDFTMLLAARDAHLHDDIMEKDGEYQYRLIEGGRNLSGGQRQRVEIARVLAKEPSLLILDEATSALDSRTEDCIVKALKGNHISTIVIAHRLSTIRSCDEIIVLDRGRIVERGTHDELRALGGLYESLITAE